MKRDNSTHSTLAKNTMMLYVLTGSNYVLGFITIPYLTRVLGAATYGIVGFGQAVAIYIQLVLDFGFLLSATAEVAKNADDSQRVSRILSGVIQAKVVLCVVCGAALFPICLFVPQFRTEPILILLFFAYAITNSFMPDFVYRGLERMSAITYRAVSTKTFFVVCIFLFVRGPQDYLLVPLFYLIGGLAAILVVYIHLSQRLGVRYSPVGVRETLASMKTSSSFFASRIASTCYSTINYVIIGILYPASTALGCYTATDKAISAGKSVSSPIADSLYPYMLRTENYKLLINISIGGFVGLSLVCGAIFVYAEPVCILLFGEEYSASASMLRVLLPNIPLALLSYLYGFPALTPIGKASFANRSVVYAAVLQVALLSINWVLGSLTVMHICYCTLITESFLAISRTFVFARAYLACK